MEHRLAAILSADVVGYTRMIASDEAATIGRVSQARGQIAAGVARHGGRVVDDSGDNVLAEFRSSLDALRCAVEVQRALADLVALLPETARIAYRIGLHLGDVAVEGERLYGDGVNVAARLQALADAGGICLSAAVHENVSSRIDLPFRDLGEQQLKNFPRPLRAFALGEFHSGAASAPAAPLGQALIVLPFANVSEGAEQEHFADGMSEDLITELARVPGLSVIGRGTSFAYKGRSAPARELGRELGVSHVVEGSVRRAGARVRITARLSDAASGRELWSERYDRELGDVFALQDEVVGGVVEQLRRALDLGIAHVPRQHEALPEAWSLLVQARAKSEFNTPGAVREMRALLERAVALDESFAAAWAELSRTESTIYLFAVDDERILGEAQAHARRALELDPDAAEGHASLAFALALARDFDGATASARRGLALAPGRSDVRLNIATVLVMIGRTEDGIPILKDLSRLDPALRYMHLFQLGLCYRRMGRYDEAIAKHRESSRLEPDFLGTYMNLVAIYAQLGEMNQARAALAQVMRVRPDFSIARIPRLPTGREWLAEHLRKAGLGES